MSVLHREKLVLSAVMAAALLAVWLIGCAHRPPEATPPQAAAPPATQPTTAPAVNGPQAWGEACGRCHNVRAPTEFSDAQWQAIVHHMRLRANLTGEQQRAITQFLQSAN